MQFLSFLYAQLYSNVFLSVGIFLSCCSSFVRFFLHYSLSLEFSVRGKFFLFKTLCIGFSGLQTGVNILLVNKRWPYTSAFRELTDTPTIEDWSTWDRKIIKTNQSISSYKMYKDMKVLGKEIRGIWDGEGITEDDENKQQMPGEQNDDCWAMLGFP
jgi:hypothetical protein